LVANNKAIQSKDYSKLLKKILGFKPKKMELYFLAFTHKSFDPEETDGYYNNNERLEFLGDAILDAAVSDLLYQRFPTADEGFLTKMRTKIVNGQTLTEIAKKIELNKLLFVKSHKNISERIYEDAFEALIGAIYIDRGLKYVKHFVSQKIFVEHINLNQLKYVDTNYKSKVIEWSQKHKIDIEFCTSEDYDDKRNFECRLKIHDNVIGEGSGISKKIAEQFASKDALEKIKSGDFNLEY